MTNSLEINTPSGSGPDTRTRFTTSTEQPLFLREDGPADGEPLLLLHGGPGAHHDYLYPQFLELSRTHRLITYDQRGGGQSRTTHSAPITWQTHTRDLAAVLEELQLERPTIVGYSWGALLAMLYATEHLGSVGEDGSESGNEAGREYHARFAPSHLVLVSPAPLNRMWRDEFEQTLAERQRSDAIAGARRALADSDLRGRDPDAYRQRAFELSVAGYFADPARAVSLTPFRVTGRVQQSVWESLGRYDLGQKLRGLTLPALVIHGRQDPIPLASAQATAEALRATFVPLDDCGHVPYVEQPTALFSAISEFLDHTCITSDR